LQELGEKPEYIHMLNPRPVMSALDGNNFIGLSNTYNKAAEIMISDNYLYKGKVKKLMRSFAAVPNVFGIGDFRMTITLLVILRESRFSSG
jgi:hypothetical protein